ncbi:pulmonary surfactant-associated protein D [Suncus etruscus]|uniref:pulmonary surfactant-associated protein D n=1 Tax=Suncus etruscus TaxID=109475 RepID=UPI0021109C37|nr:pulmonary surfactant-associated protein D [Suncus etruscus]
MFLPLSALILLTQPWGSLGAEMKNYSPRSVTNACTLVMCNPLENGLPGRDGRDGREGPRGEKGDPGLPGAEGRAGMPGPPGPVGAKGDNGSVGDPGPKGDCGARGLPGPPGMPGPAGREGPSGKQGNAGPEGKAGPKGEPGPKGDMGATGMQGSAGTKGPPGVKGERGPPGEHGAPGNSGPPGHAGLPGPAGPAGPRGLTGSPGPKGDKGDSGDAILQQQLAALQKQVQSMQETSEKNEKAGLFPHGRRVGKKIFKSGSFEKTFQEAQQVCIQAGGHLPSPRSVTENEALQQIVTAENKSAFLSMTDIKTEGKFTYPTGEPLAYANWAPGEPNNNGQAENCVEIFGNGKWNDKSCGEKRLVICEF